MDHNNEANRRIRNEKDGNEDIKATVRLAEDFIRRQVMTEKEALKYFNLSQKAFDRFRNDR